jgi:hypothetical protein
MTNILEGIASDIKSLLKRVSHLEVRRTPTWVYLTTPLTSTDWDGDAHSTTAKTLIDLSAIFGVPAGVKAIKVVTVINDSSSAAGYVWLRLANNNTDQIADYIHWLAFATNDGFSYNCGTVSCDNNGDIYYQISASGVNTMDIIIQIYGYLI